MKFFEEIHIGDRRELGRHSFTAEDIRSYAMRYDPQPFHLDEEAAARSHYGALIASGWQTAVVCMRLMAEANRRLAAEMAARGEAAAKLGPSPGFRNLRWPKPVYAGDSISYAGETIEKRETESPPGWGLVVFHMRGTNQDGTLVIEFENAVLIERRPK